MAAPQNKVHISGRIPGGYNFRHLWVLIKQLCAKASIAFSKKGIEIRQVDAQKRVLFIAEIRGCDLIDYKYQIVSDDKNMEDVASVVSVVTKDMCAALTSCGRQHEFGFLIQDTKKMMYSIAGNKTSQSSGAHILSFADVTDDPDMEPNFKRQESEPNLTMQVAEFVTLCKEVEKRKGQKMTITGFDRGLQLLACKANHEVLLSHEYGDCTATVIGGQIKHIDDKDVASKTVAAVNDVFSFGMNTDQKKMLTDAVDSLGKTFGLIPVKSAAAPPPAQIDNSLKKVSCVITLPKKKPGIKISFDEHIIKAFTKMKQLCTQGNIRFYIENDDSGVPKPLKLITPIGAYGLLRIYVENH